MKEQIGIAGTGFAAQIFLSRLKGAGLSFRPLGQLAGPAAAGHEGPETLLLVPRDIMESETLLFESEAFGRMPWVRTIAIAATLSPRYTRALRGRIPERIALIDAPFIGTQRQLETGLPSFLLGGDSSALEKLKPVFDILAADTSRMGDFGTAMAAKVLRDCLAAANSAMTRAALEWAGAQGIEELRLVSLLESSFGTALPKSVCDPATLVVNALPGDNAGVALVKKVESAIDAALAGVHLTPPQGFSRSAGTARPRHLH